MPPPATGQIRVFAWHSVRGLRAHRWHDVVPTSEVRDFLSAGLVSLTGPRGEEPPEDLPRRRCCGG